MNTGQLGTFTFSGNVSVSANQMTILVGDSASTGPSRDGTLASMDLDPAGGAVCWDGTPDCVSWGNFSGGALPSSAGTAAVAMSGGQALRRSIAAGCSTMLQVSDDTNVSSADFSLQTPNPRNNASAIVETPCNPPTVTIDTKPATKTKTTSAGFTFHSTPAGATFQCKLDSEPEAACNSGSVNYPGPLAEGAHVFKVTGTTSGGTSSPVTHNWEVDNTAPLTTIGNPKPPTPNSGASLTFKFSASESGVAFVCSLAKGAEPDSFTSCVGTGKTYSGLTDGSYTFKVHGTDTVGNVGGDASYAFTVDTSLKDTTPPETTIKTKPTDPSSSTTADFTYESNEAGSTFECKLDAEAFAACPAGGKSYTGLAEGQHTFQVRAIDASANPDASPATYTFSIVLPAGPGPEIKPPDVTPPPDTAPETTLTSKPKAKTKDKTPTFKFTASPSSATFECSLDSKPFKSCRSPLTASSLKPGKHSFKVRAVSAGGLRDPSPAAASFKVVKKK
jgi:hypothetical protein